MIETEEEKLSRITRYQRKFQEGIPFEQKLRYLKYLQDVDISLNILIGTSIGKTVSVLRKENGEIGGMATELVAKWKKIVTTHQNEANAVLKSKQQISGTDVKSSPSKSSATEVRKERPSSEKSVEHSKASSTSTERKSSSHKSLEDDESLKIKSKKARSENSGMENEKINEYKKLMSSEYINRADEQERDEKPSRMLLDAYSSGSNNSKVLDEACMVPMLPSSQKKPKQEEESKMLDEASMVPMLPTSKKKPREEDSQMLDEASMVPMLPTSKKKLKEEEDDDDDEPYVAGSLFKKKVKDEDGGDDSYVAGSMFQKSKQKAEEDSYVSGSLFQKRASTSSPPKEGKDEKHSDSLSGKKSKSKEKERGRIAEDVKNSEKHASSNPHRKDRDREKEHERKTERHSEGHSAHVLSEKDKNRERKHEIKSEVSSNEEKVRLKEKLREKEKEKLKEKEKEKERETFRKPEAVSEKVKVKEEIKEEETDNEKKAVEEDAPKKKTKSFEAMLLMPMIAAAKTKKKKKTEASIDRLKNTSLGGECSSSSSSGSSSKTAKESASKHEAKARKASPELDEESTKSESKKKSGGQKSFEEMLMMPSIPTPKKKKSKKIEKSISESLSTLPDVELPQIDTTPTYKPIRAPPSPPSSSTSRTAPTPAPVEKTPSFPMEIRDEDITSRRTKSVMYSGRKVQSDGIVHSLYSMCMKVLIENVDSLYETGGVPYSVLEPLLVKVSPAQLERLEYYNPHFIADTDKLWRKHCYQTFKTQKIDEDSVGAWRDTYKDLIVEREEKLKRLSAKISVNQATKTPERSTKLAFMARAPKPSAQIARAQKRFGTGADKEKEREREREREREKERMKRGKYVDPKHSKHKKKSSDSVSEASSSDDMNSDDEEEERKRKRKEEEKRSQKDIRQRMMLEQEESSEAFVPFGNVPSRDRCSGKRPPTSLTSSGANLHPPSKKSKTKDELGSVAPPQFTPAKKKKKSNPMMLKTMKMLKKQKGRINSSIMRR